ncbi:Serine/threonine-protein kinase H1 [Cladorrhinum sp. PSN259]|nr:Serine/threonine-protein kinase H1 [Cladorrhinum sp. PSN259]
MGQPDEEVLSSPLLEHVLQLLAQCEQVSLRLSHWCETHTVSGDLEPLTALLLEGINILAKKTTEFGIEASRYATLADKGVVTSDDDARLLSLLTALKVHLFRVLELQPFHQNEERRGQDGALNTRFAITHILQGVGTRRRSGAFRNEDKLMRIGFRLKDLVDSFGAHLGQPTPVPEAVRILRIFQSQITEFSSSAAEQIKPRHLSTYNAFSDTPYVGDPEAETVSGSFGTVQKVCHRRTGEALAMKRFHDLWREKDRKLALQEIGVLEVCFHKNIVELVEAFQLEDGDIRMVISPWAPFTLYKFLNTTDIMRRKRCPWFVVPGSHKSDRCIYRLVYELADGVSYLHGHTIKHKDLKPGNILLLHEDTDRVTPLITDVGTSKVYVPGAETNYIDSTYEYLAPEQHEKQSSTLQADIWQLGCCFAEILSVIVGGTAAHEKLVDSYNRDGRNCSCCIAKEHGPFMKALDEICLKGNSAIRRVHGLVRGMLDPDPASRLEIGIVKAQLAKLVGV